MTTQNPQRLIGAAGLLTLAAAAAPASFDVLWWALVPAAGLLAIGLLARPSFAERGRTRVGALALAGALILALFVTTIGWVVQARLGIEPAWIVSLSNVSGSAIVGAACLLGMTIAAGQGPRIAGLLLAAALPLGLAIDWLTAALVPFGQFFLNGAGFYVGLLLCGVALIRLARRRTATSRPPDTAARAL